MEPSVGGRSIGTAVLGVVLTLWGCVALPQDPITPAGDARLAPDAEPDAEARAPDAAVTQCMPSPEVCDGVDNDCNGSIDDDVTDDEGGCRVGVGACRADGEERCVLGTLRCNAVPGDASEERCDDVDNDCDGVIDEAEGGWGECAREALGVCATGRLTCTEGELDCEPEAEAAEEVCDGLDGDCDGAVDNVPNAVCCVAGSEDPPCNGCPGGTLVPDGWVCIPAGVSQMGHEGLEEDEAPVHRVTLTRPALLMQTEVTEAQWAAVFRNNPATSEQSEAPCAECPVETVNWYEAAAYANALSEADGLVGCYTFENCEGVPGEGMECSRRVVFAGTDCLGYRLPTEAEWEYATRAGATTLFWFGDDAAELGEVGWYRGNSAVEVVGEEVAVSHPVARLRANPWGLYDVHGNVAEWVHDWHREYGAADQTDPPGAGRMGELTCEQACERFHDFCELDQQPDAFTVEQCVAVCPETIVPQCIDEILVRPGECPYEALTDCAQVHFRYRIYRGGSYVTAEGETRSAVRAQFLPTLRHNTIGFRVLRRVP